MSCTQGLFPFVTVRDFTPNSRVNWRALGQVQSVVRNGVEFTLQVQGASKPVVISVLGPRAYRLRFNPDPGSNYGIERSVAVVNRVLGAVNVTVTDSAAELVLDTGNMRIHVDKQSFRIQVYRGTQLVHADEPGFNVVYIPGSSVIANMKTRAGGARYSGLGEKAGSRLLKNDFTYTNFNFDNFGYVNSPLPPNNGHGPLNPSEALYTSIPFLLETNPAPQGSFAGGPYACGIFFDNASQSYFNISSSDYSDMSGKYYFGALYGDLDYYFMLGDLPGDVLAQYTTLTGRSPMPPKYVFGYHQGAYGYYSRGILENIASSFRSAQFPIDGLHIDVDFQDNYRTFTHSDLKFPQAAAMLAGLRSKGFKASTNITPLLTRNQLNEQAQIAAYDARDALRNIGGLIFDTHAGQGPNPAFFEGTVSYGLNRKVNLNYGAYPGLDPNSDGDLPLSAPGNYPDFGRDDVRRVWGDQYAHLINDLGLEMIWQDMTCPALSQSPATPCKTFPLDLMTNDTNSYVPHSLMHSAYALLLLRATWEGLARLRPAKRNFIIARGGYAGLQRYAGLWTGDSASTWSFLAVTVPEVLNLGISGVPIAGADVGGFGNVGDPNGTAQPAQYPGGRVIGGITNYELLTRWMQVGSFLPWYRNHYDGYNKQFQEPIKYGEPVPTNCRKYVELRYRMMQLYYDCMFEWTQTGMPICRALFLNDPQDEQAYNHLDDQFFVGRDLLVAPILEQWETAGRSGPAIRDVYLPAGNDWYAFKDDQAPLDDAVQGGTTVAGYRAGLDLVPLYVRAGAIIPMRNLEQFVGELAMNPLTITIYPGPSRSYRLYQDDGVTTNAAANGDFRTTDLTQTSDTTSRCLTIRRVHDQFQPAEDHYYVSFLGIAAAPSRVLIQNQQIPSRASRALLQTTASNGYYFDVQLRTAYVKVMDQTASANVCVVY